MRSRSPPIKSPVSPKKKTISVKKDSIFSTSSEKISITQKAKDAENIEILKKIFAMKIPNNIYPYQNLALEDLLRKGDNTIAYKAKKAILDAATNLGSRKNIVLAGIIQLIAFLISDSIEYEEVKKFITTKALDIIKQTRATGDFLFAEIYLKMVKDKVPSLLKHKTKPFLLLIPIIAGTYVTFLQGKNRDSILKYLGKEEFSTSVSFVTETPEFTGETNAFLISEKIIEKGDTILSLEKLGLKSSEISSVNPKGISIEYNPVVGVKNPINVSLMSKVPYFDDTVKFLVGDIAIIRTSTELNYVKEKMILLIEFYQKKLEEISFIYSNITKAINHVSKYETLTTSIAYTLDELRKADQNDPKIKIYENLGLEILPLEGEDKKKLAKKYGLPLQAVVDFIELRNIRETLLLSGINILNDAHRMKILEANRSDSFIRLLRYNLNIINDIRSRLIAAKKSVINANTGNINIVKLRVEDTGSVVSSAIYRIEKYDPKNPLEFFSKTKPSEAEIQKSTLRNSMKTMKRNLLA